MALPFTPTPLLLRLANGIRALRGEPTRVIVGWHAASLALRQDVLLERGKIEEHEAAIHSGLNEIAGDRDDTIDDHTRSWTPYSAEDQIKRRSYARRRIQKKSVEAYVASALWANMFNLTLGLSLGSHVTVEATDKYGPVAKAIDRFLKEPGNPIANARLWCLRLMLFGELAAPATISERWGRVIYQQWHPYDIRDVEFQNGDDQRPERVMLANSQSFREGRTKLLPGMRPRDTSWQQLSGHMPISDYRDNDNSWWRTIGLRPYGQSTRSEFDMRLVNGEPLLDGTCLYSRWDTSVDSYGLPAFVQSLDFVGRLNLALYDLQWREEMKRNFVWRGVIPGASNDDVRTLNDPKNRQKPVPGTIVWTNDKDGGLFPMTHSLDAADSETFFRLVKKHIILASGLPEFMFAEHDANRATTVTQLEPAIKVLEDVQRRLVQFLETSLRYRIDTEIYWNAIPPTAERGFRLVVPALSTEDTKTKIDSIEALSRTLRLAVESGILHREVAAMIMQKQIESADLATTQEMLRALGLYGKSARVPVPELPQAGVLGEEMPIEAEKAGQRFDMTEREAAVLELVRAKEQRGEPVDLMPMRRAS